MSGSLLQDTNAPPCRGLFCKDQLTLHYPFYETQQQFSPFLFPVLRYAMCWARLYYKSNNPIFFPCYSIFQKKIDKS